MDLIWRDLRADELKPPQLYDVLALRNRVFVVEQECSYQDVDGLDLAASTWHVCGRTDRRTGALLAAYARVLAPTAAETARIGRVVVAPEARGHHLAGALMGRALAVCSREWPGRDVRIGAQAHLERFYAGLGFRTVSGVYDEDGIPHVDMVRSPA